MLADRMYTKSPTGKSKEKLDALLFDRAAGRNHTNPYEEKTYRGAAIKEVQAWWKQCKEWIAHLKGQRASLVFDFKSVLKALSGKKAEVQSEEDAFMDILWGVLDLRYVFRSKKVLVFDAMEDITNDEYLARS